MRSETLKDFKLLTIDPRQYLSLQKHANHEEVWLAITNIRVIVGNDLNALKVRDVQAGEYVRVPCGWYHTIINPTDQLMLVFEERITLHGAKINRDTDIERVYDDYGRSRDLFPMDLRLKMLSKL